MHHRNHLLALCFKNCDTRTLGFIYCTRINTGGTSWGCIGVNCSSSITENNVYGLHSGTNTLHTGTGFADMSCQSLDVL